MLHTGTCQPAQHLRSIVRSTEVGPFALAPVQRGNRTTQDKSVSPEHVDAGFLSGFRCGWAQLGAENHEIHHLLRQAAALCLRPADDKQFTVVTSIEWRSAFVQCHKLCSLSLRPCSCSCELAVGECFAEQTAREPHATHQLHLKAQRCPKIACFMPMH